MWINKEDMKDFIIAIILTIILIIIFSCNGTQQIDDATQAGNGLNYIGNTGEFLPMNGTEIMDMNKELIHTYNLSNSERDLIEHVVMGLAENEEMTVQKAIAQCILNACVAFDERPDCIIEILRYTEYRPVPSTEVKQSVSDIFDNGELILEQDVFYLYNYKQSDSNWHESQEYVCTIGSYKFFK